MAIGLTNPSAAGGGGGVSGSGTNNYVTRWTPDGSTLGVGKIQDDGTNVSVNTTPNSVIQFLAYWAGGAGKAISGQNNSISGGNNVGVDGQAYGTAPSGTNIGGWFLATGGGSNYAVKLQDGTQAAGRFLKSITADGEANWAQITKADITGGVSGSGTNNYVTRWTPDGSSLGNSTIQDNGATSSSGGWNPDASAQHRVRATATARVYAFEAEITGSTEANNYGGSFSNINASTTNAYGVRGSSTGANTTNVGGVFSASGATNNYGVRIFDGTQAAGRFLKSVTANGEANWAQITKADITGGVSGSGTNNYVTRWTPDGSSLGNATIRDDGTTAAIGAAPSTLSSFQVSSSRQIAVYITNSNTGASSVGNGVEVSGAATSNYGVSVSATNGVSRNNGARFCTVVVNTPDASTDTGVYASANHATRTNIGGHFVAGDAGGSGSKYSVKLQDGTQGSGKFLKSVTANGEANWADLASSDIKGVQTNRLLGRYSAGTGVAQEIQIGSGLSLSAGGTLSASGGGGSSPLTTKGDLYTYSTADARLGVGTNGQVLIADSTQTTGIKWGAVNDANAIHSNVSSEISAITAKSTLADADIFLIEDSAATNAKKKTTLANLKTAIGSGGTPGVVQAIPSYILANSDSQSATSGSYYACKVVPTVSRTVTQMAYYVTGASSGKTVYVGIYDNSGNLLAEGSGNTNAIGIQTVTLGSSVAISANTEYYFAIIEGSGSPNFATTATFSLSTLGRSGYVSGTPSGLPATMSGSATTKSFWLQAF